MFASFTLNRLSIHSGTILIELLIASLLGLVITSFLYEIYLVSYQNFHLQLSLNQIEDSAKTATDILTSEIKYAGYMGCAKLTDDFPIISYQHYKMTPQNKLIITENTITVRHASLNHVVLLTAMQNPTILMVSDRVRFKKNNLLIISDCKHAEIFQVKHVSFFKGMQKITPVQPLHYLFDPYAEVGRFESNHYFVSRSALYLENIHRTKIRLVDGINAIHIQCTNDPSKQTRIAINLDIVAQSLHKDWHVDVSL